MSAPTLTFRLSGLMSKVVATSMKPDATIDDIIRVLKDAVLCAKAQRKSGSHVNYPVRMIHRIARR